MVTRNHDTVLRQKDHKEAAGCRLVPEAMSAMGPVEINGCMVTMSFAEEKDPAIDQAVAEMLIESYMRRCSA